MTRRMILSNIVIVLVVLLLAVFGIYFFYQNNHYLKTNDAVVSADMVQIVAPQSGLLEDWNVKEGENVRKKDVVGQVSNGKTNLPVAAMMKGMIIKNEIRPNSMVQLGQVLAHEADMDHLYVMANIKETDLKDVSVGDNVDVKVDGDPGTIFNGKVKAIGYATNSVFSALPTDNTSGSYTKVTQKVPVKISISDPSDKVLPGMNAEIKIAKK
ncbi:MAG TPA: efflux RND transporter periplasmic adaptor subunit [Candidatus Angelobacter sp.]|nr:efflux RND transporter periplasmic adaptor subunit [Candidatus Angelobacter sp.]